MKRSHVCLLVWLALFGMLLPLGAVNATQVNSWETGLEGWGPSGFGNGSEFVNTTNLASTDGLQALELGHPSTDPFNNFSWDASIVFGGPSAANPSGPFSYQQLSNVYANPAGQTVEFDVIYKAALLNSAPFTFANMSFSIQDDASFRNEHGLVGISTPQDTVFHVSLPLDSGSLSGGVANSGFYRMTIALNTDPSVGTISSVLVDNLVITPEPASLLLVGMAGSVLGLVRRRRRA